MHKHTGIRRRDFLAGAAIGVTALTSARSVAQAAITMSDSKKRLKGLAEPAFRPLAPGSIVAEGWLERQLRIQADGLSGHLDEFWPDVGQSQWFGGKAEGWERAPYWLDGFIPLAWALNDPALKAKAGRYVDHIVSAQRPDGWYAPFPADASARTYDLWAILLANKVLAQYHEATGDERVLEAVKRNLKATLTALDRTPLFGWGRFRWFEGLIPVYYVYELTGEPWLLDLARKLCEQGFDYMAFYQGADIVSPTPRRGLWTWEKHVVNTAMALKAYGLSWRLTRDERERAFPARMIEILDRYHGQVTGMFSGDECLAGRNPLQGTELCAVVEAVFSLAQLVSVTGDPAFGDRLERVSFNALPATFSPDMWAHQYVQQVNQAQATINPEFMWSTNGAESNIYGLEPNYGCCTANMHQGWPKFVSHLWMRAPGEGIALAAYAPSTVRFVSRGAPVQASLETDYPFRETLKVTVKTERKAKFPVYFRVPAWAEGASLRVAGGAGRALRPGTFHKLERIWEGTTEVTLHFPMKCRTTRRYNQALAIERGPLVYALKIGEQWTRVNANKPHRELPHGDFEVRPATPWNYGLLVDERPGSTSISFEERPVGSQPFSPEGAGMIARVKGRRLPQWKMAHGWAAEVPPTPQSSKEPLEDVTLIPYGCTSIRIAEFPRLNE